MELMTTMEQRAEEEDTKPQVITELPPVECCVHGAVSCCEAVCDPAFAALQCQLLRLWFWPISAGRRAFLDLR